MLRTGVVHLGDVIDFFELYVRRLGASAELPRRRPAALDPRPIGSQKRPPTSNLREVWARLKGISCRWGIHDVHASCSRGDFEQSYGRPEHNDVLMSAILEQFSRS